MKFKNLIYAVMFFSTTLAFSRESTLMIPHNINSNDLRTHGSLFPRSGTLFSPLIADPQDTNTHTYYTNMNNDNVVDFNLGHSFGLYKWYLFYGDVIAQLDLSGVIMSRFSLKPEINTLESTNFIINLPIEAYEPAHDHSIRITLYHESSHEGDVKLNNGNYSKEGLNFVFAQNWENGSRVYFGSGLTLHSLVTDKNGDAQVGVEIMVPFVTRFGHIYYKPYIATDLQFKAETDWRTNSNIQCGYIIGTDRASNSIKVFVGYYNGGSRYGQLYNQLESYLNIGAGFHF